MRSRRIIIAAVLLAVLVPPGCFVAVVLRKVHGDIRDFAMLDAEKMIVRHMESHDLRWPRSWAELEQASKGFASPPSGQRIQEIKDFVVVDWSFDPSQWDYSSDPPAGWPNPIRFTDEDHHSHMTETANRLLYIHIRDRIREREPALK